MENKEIIINKVNVSECEYLDLHNFCHCDNSKENEGEERITDSENSTVCITQQQFKDYLNLKRKIKRIKRILTHCEKQSGCIGCKYEYNCEASYNFNNWILEIIKDKKDE